MGETTRSGRGGSAGGSGFRREVAYDALPSQARFHLLASRFRGFSGPVGSGKTAAFAQQALRLAYTNGACLGLIGAATYRMLADVTRRAFLDVLESNAIPHRFEKAANSVRLHEPGAEIIFRSLDQPERLVGTNLAWFGCDELTYSKEDAWRRLEARLREPKARELCGFAVWTPKGFDWVYNRFVGPERVTGYQAIFARPGENRWLPADFYERLKASYDERFFRQEALGEYLPQFAGQVYYTFDRMHNVRAAEFDPAWPLCWALDFNIDPMCSVLAQVKDVTTRAEALQGRRVTEIHVLDELALPDCRTEQACRALWDRIEKLRLCEMGLRSIQVYGDASGAARRTSSLKSDWQIVKEFLRRETPLQASFRIPAANPPVRERAVEVCGALQAADGRRRLFVDPRCKELILDFEQVFWKRDAAGNALGDISKADPKRTHISDALGYLVWRERAAAAGPRADVIL